MKLGVVTVLFQDLKFEAMLDRVVEEGLQAVEIATGGYLGKAHCDPQVLLDNPSKLKEWQGAIAAQGLELTALSCHGNPLHPQTSLARAFHDDFVNTVLLAEQLGLERVVLLSGCPGEGENARYPNWVVAPWPGDFPELLRWQWEEKVIPYWREQASFAGQHGVTKLCFEMLAGFAVYNVETMLRLREAVGETVGANLDPSHLFWQGVDIAAVIRELGREGALFYVHAKDTALEPLNVAVNGVLDPKPLSDIVNRSWLFRTVGYGHGELDWRRIVSALRQAGYDDVLSIEHEDALTSPSEGLRKAVKVLKEVMLAEQPGKAFWA